MIIAKDRPGFVEEVARGRTAAEFHLDAINPDILVAALEPAEDMPVDDHGDMRPTILMEKISRFLEGIPGANTNTIKGAKLGKTAYVLRALQALITEGYIDPHEGERKAVHHYVLRPYRRDESDT